MLYYHHPQPLGGCLRRHQIDIAGRLFRLSKAEVTRLEKAYGQITDQDAKLLAGTHGDLAMIWIVRTRIWNQWVRINRDAAQPTAFVPNMLPSERKARATAAKAVLPRMESYRQLFDKTPGRLSETMKRIINDRIGQLRQAIQAGGG